jgi:NAD(P)-dependent dehydrogenase (short-subunit alcohol dehydrogenase family)
VASPVGTPGAPRALDGKVILVVGGTAGIGASAAAAIVASGAAVAVTSHDEPSIEDARRRFQGAVDVIHADARDPAAAEGAVARVVSRYGRLDGLYHVAGGSGRRYGDGPLHEVTDDGWRETLRLNLDSVFYSNRAAVRQFLRQGQGGAIVNLGSVLASSPAPRFFATHAYATAKSGIEGLTRSIASCYASCSIRANVVVPGLAETPMARRALGDDAIMRFVRSKQPLDSGRAGRPEDFDAAAVFLLGDGSRFVTGQSLVVDGGWSCTDGQYVPTPGSAH